MAKYAITIHSGEDRYYVESDGESTLLEVMNTLKISVRHPCRNGVCGACRCHLVSGSITYHWREPHGLWEKDVVEGYILPCIAFTTSNLVVDQLSLDNSEGDPTT